MSIINQAISNRMLRNLLKQITFTSIFVGAFVPQVLAWQTDTTHPNVDTTGVDSRTRVFSNSAEKKRVAELAADRTAIEQYKTLERLSRTIQNAKAYLKTTRDTTSIDETINILEQRYNTAINGVLINRPTLQTFRNLTATISILQQLALIAEKIKLSLELKHEKLSLYRYELDSLLAADPLGVIHTDSLNMSRYLRQIAAVNQQLNPIDSLLDLTSHRIQARILATTEQLNLLIDGIDEIQKQHAMITDHLWEQEIVGISDGFQTGISFHTAAIQARDKGKLTLLYYISNNKGRILLGGILWLIMALYLRSLKLASKSESTPLDSKGGGIVLKHPFFTALLLTCSLYQFAFISPPYIFRASIWLIASIALTAVIETHITRYWMWTWLSLVVLFFVGSILNLLLQPSQTELILLCILCITGITIGLLSLLKGPRNELREKLILYPIGFMVALEACALVACMTGRYNFSKSLMITGFSNVLIAIHFLWTLRLVNDWLLMASQWYRQQNRKFLYLNPDKIGSRAPFIFYALLIIGWFWLIGKNFPGFDNLIEPINTLLTSERKLGDYNFTISNLFLFFAIITTAVVLSKIVSFFTSDRVPREHSPLQKMQSWLLLVRIAIIILGVFLAVAATGIPLDRITLVLGALSVGVGFGLQSLVNNLVSGLIIAFERPVHVGDNIDIDGQAGVMKSIGFRRSVIYTQEGADMIIPNGDLLNAHLINWSLAGNRKRMKISFEIPFDIDIEKVRELVKSALEKDKRILKSPSPGIQFGRIHEGAIEVAIYFWPHNLSDGPQAQTDLIEILVGLFKQNNMSFTVPRQDIYLRGDKNSKTT